MPRVVLLAALIMMLFGTAAVAQPDAVAAEWVKYRERFVAADGRVIDTGNRAVSHSEGQGSAMLFAGAADDRTSFDRIWNWTRANLQRPDNALFAWRWDPADRQTPVADPNNASDGDILIAWALIRATHRWKHPGHAGYAGAARRILADIRRRLIVATPRMLVLLPGADGFMSEDGVLTLNPSYYVYPALKDFARFLPAPEWQGLRQGGLRLLADARFGRWRLTPDWIEISEAGAIVPAAKFPARFGFEAIRVPLYLIWAGEATRERLASYLAFWNDFGQKQIPAWTELTDNGLAPYPAPKGFQAIVELTRGVGQSKPPPLPTIGDQDDYYSASLSLLAALARREAPR